MTHTHAPPLNREPTPDLAKRLDDIGWALFLILTGALWLVPESQVPPGTWLLSTGALLLGLNIVRVVARVPVSRFLMALGLLAVVAGLSALWGMHLPLAAICLILLGSGMLARQLRRSV
jgi:hypothetical protein